MWYFIVAEGVMSQLRYMTLYLWWPLKQIQHSDAIGDAVNRTDIHLSSGMFVWLPGFRVTTRTV